MIKTIKIPWVFLSLALVVFLPKASYAWDNQQGHNEGGRAHQEHGNDLRHRNPDLTLVSGMEGIDSRVLIAADPVQAPEVIEQPEQVIEAAPAPIVNSDGDSITVNVPNNAGGFTPIIIRKFGNGYLGPQGELYFPFPQISQLKAIYSI